MLKRSSGFAKFYLMSNFIAVNARPNAFNKEIGVILIRATNRARAIARAILLNFFYLNSPGKYPIFFTIYKCYKFKII